MNNLISFIERTMAPIAKKISKNPWVKAIQNAFFASVPVTLIGSICLLLGNPVLDSSTMDPGILKSFMQGWEAVATTLHTPLETIRFFTLGNLTLYVVFGIGYNLGKSYKLNQQLTSIIALFSFFVSSCLSLEGPTAIQFTDSSGLFTGIIVSIASVEFARFLINKKIGTIDISKYGVPDVLAASFNSMIPIGIVGAVFVTIGILSLSVLGTPLPGIMGIIFSPLMNAVDSVWFVIIYWLLTALLWWAGVHDATLYAPISGFICMALLANQDAYAAGTALNNLPYVFTDNFWWWYLNYGILPLCIMCLTSKSHQIKSIGKIAIVPSVFNVSEPLLFGLPILFNTTLLVPWCICPVVNSTVAFILTKTGLINGLIFSCSQFIPYPLLMFIQSIDIMASLLSIVLLVIDALIWYPFFKAYEKQKLDEELNNSVEQG